MKTSKVILLTMALCFCVVLQAQEFRETIKKELQFASSNSKNVLHVQNVNGSIAVEGYNGSTILGEVKKVIKAKISSKVFTGFQEIDFESKPGEVVIPYTVWALDKMDLYRKIQMGQLLEYFREHDE